LTSRRSGRRPTANAPLIRTETASDIEAVFRVNEAAFGEAVEAELVDALRANGHLVLSLVAEVNGAIVGHIAYSPVSFEPPRPAVKAVLLGPVAVAPERQRQGIGGALIQEGSERLRSQGYNAVFLVGHPEYYPRFGFCPGREFNVHYLDDRDAFMALELSAGVLGGFDTRLLASEEFAPFE
jgi:putative acetyltransferase